MLYTQGISKKNDFSKKTKQTNITCLQIYAKM